MPDAFPFLTIAEGFFFATGFFMIAEGCFKGAEGFFMIAVAEGFFVIAFAEGFFMIAVAETACMGCACMNKQMHI